MAKSKTIKKYAKQSKRMARLMAFKALRLLTEHPEAVEFFAKNDPKALEQIRSAAHALAQHYPILVDAAKQDGWIKGVESMAAKPAPTRKRKPARKT